ncbi:MAG: Arm DNA-binding domain-containing protein [Kaiparowitsia implicata GSE-PSE-MK54-09C]|nr:Arm DNA-binding domain-containing protein [Kaiparowitsia implicata GSE-PSE-MK54-09C]
MPRIPPDDQTHQTNRRCHRYQTLYVVQYRAAGRSRRATIGLHGVWTPEEARREAKVLLGQVARGGNPAEERKLDREAITVKELWSCAR